MWSEVCHRERRQPASWTSLGRVTALGAAAGGVAMPQPLRFARCCYTAVIAPDGAALHSHRIERCCYAQSSLCAVLLCHSHCASRCAAIPLHRVLDHATQNANGSPLHRIERCCYAQSSLRAVLLCHSHCASRCAAIPQSSLHAVLGLLCHSHRFVRCWVPMPWQSRSAVPGRRRRGADVPGGAATTNIGRRVGVRAGVQVSVWRS